MNEVELKLSRTKDMPNFIHEHFTKLRVLFKYICFYNITLIIVSVGDRNKAEVF